MNITEASPRGFFRYVVEGGKYNPPDEYPEPVYDSDDLEDAKSNCREDERIYDMKEHKYIDK